MENEDWLEQAFAARERERNAIPADWMPDHEGLTFALGRGIDVSFNVKAFRDHHLSRPRSGPCDWQALWRTWCLYAERSVAALASIGAPVCRVDAPDAPTAVRDVAEYSIATVPPDLRRSIQTFVDDRSSARLWRWAVAQPGMRFCWRRGDDGLPTAAISSREGYFDVMLTGLQYRAGIRSLSRKDYVQALEWIEDCGSFTRVQMALAAVIPTWDPLGRARRPAWSLAAFDGPVRNELVRLREVDEVLAAAEAKRAVAVAAVAALPPKQAVMVAVPVSADPDEAARNRERIEAHIVRLTEGRERAIAARREAEGTVLLPVGVGEAPE